MKAGIFPGLFLWSGGKVEKPEIVMLAVDDLKAYERNSRTHTPEQIDKVARSIQEFGWTNPVLVAEGTILAGHARVAAARQLGIEVVPTIDLSRLTDAQRRAYVIADNALALDAGWDYELLNLELEDLEASGFDLDGIGLGDASLFSEDNQLDDAGHDSKYSLKMMTPVYEPKGDKPAVDELYDRSKASELIDSIKRKALPAEVEDFLLAAAARHVVFDYQAIAEYYAHADASIQGLMEDSALVIIDFDKAMEEGFVRLSSRLNEIVELARDE